MSQATPTTQTMTLDDARQHLDRVVARVSRRETRVLVEDDGATVAAIVSADDLRQLAELDARREEAFEAMREFSRAFADVPLEELEEQVALAVDQARAEIRAERAADR